jgi:hypothetical protein
MEKEKVTGHNRGCVTGKVRVAVAVAVAVTVSVATNSQRRDGTGGVVRGRVVADAMCQNLGPAVLKYDGQRIGEIQHEARSHYSASSERPW